MSRGCFDFRLLLPLLAASLGCEDPAPVAQESKVESKDETTSAPVKRRVDSRPPPMHQPVPFYEGGKVARKVDAATAAVDGHVVLDLGEEWTPYIFTERGSPEEEPIPNSYRKTYLALAQGRFPKGQSGDRARRDKYLELYGIMPTIAVLRARFEKVEKLECDEALDYEPLKSFEGFVAYRGNSLAKRDAERFNVVERQLTRLLEKKGLDSVDDLDPEKLDRSDKRRVRDYKARVAEVTAVRAAQERLECEGYFEKRGKYVKGALDWATHEALAEFERRHRVYGWGYIGRDTLDMLQRTPLEGERQAVIRILTERAMHAAGVLEDGSTEREGKPRTFQGADGKQHEVPNLEAELREAIIAAFGLETPESTLEWLRSLGEIPKEKLVAFHGPPLPEYYDGDMKLSVVLDRGDVWYDFPYDEEGKARPQPVRRRPRLTVFTEYLGRKIPLARYGTTIGGWRSEVVEDEVMWKYKNSPTGPRVWHQIIAAPVWIPPDSAPVWEMLEKNRDKRRDPRPYVVDYETTGPGYASAYGLVAAYHLKYQKGPDGELHMGADEGIRTHGSVDYMSIMRRNSHGCHRLHNHIAVRLMSFVLAHRPHRRVGERSINYKREIEHEEETYLLELDSRGYVFDLERPVPVEVLEGRIRGKSERPLEVAIPKYNEEIGAYILPDGGAVAVSPNGSMVPVPLPVPDGGVPSDAGINDLLNLPLPLPPARPAAPALPTPQAIVVP